MLPADVEAYIARRFDVAEREAASALCGAATIHDGSAASPRLIRCALLSSGGSLQRLRLEIEHLRVDYRDVIVSGEYVPEKGQLVRVRNLNEPFADEA